MVNFGVAIACVIRSPLGSESKVPASNATHEWFVHQRPVSIELEPDAVVYERRAIGLVSRRMRDWGRDPESGVLANVTSWRTLAGWPALSLEGTLWRFQRMGDDRTLHVEFRFSAPLPSRFPNAELGCLIPRRPLIMGTCLNVLFYSLIAWATLQLAARWRRRVRIAASRCVNCGYMLVTSNVCPECATENPRGRVEDAKEVGASTP